MRRSVSADTKRKALSGAVSFAATGKLPVRRRFDGELGVEISSVFGALDRLCTR
jgi:hypothetical protein